jgi:Pyridine nucleotide-disulphide oxidoreductase
MPYPGASPGAGIDGRYEVVVMGAGPAGEAAAEHAGNPGYSVASVERDTVGGTVVTNGGRPAKTFRKLQRDQEDGHLDPASPPADDSRHPAGAILSTVDPRDRLRSVGRRMTDPVEPIAQRVAERAIDLVVNALDVNALVARVDLNAIVRNVDLDEILKQVDVNVVVDRLDVNTLLNRVDVNALLDRLDVNALLDRLDVNALLGRVDLSPILDRVDVNSLLDRADIDNVLRRVDVGAVVDRVDVGAVVDRVDVGAVVDRVDVNEVVGRIDMDVLVEQTDLGAVIARSSGGVASEALDAARSQAVGLDQFIDRWVQRLLRRKHPGPLAPPALLTAQAELAQAEQAQVEQ